MDEPSTSHGLKRKRSVRYTEPDFSDHVRDMLDFSDEEDGADNVSVIDDSDNDPDFLFSDENVQNTDSEGLEGNTSGEEEEQPPGIFDQGNNVVQSNANSQKIFYGRVRKNEPGPGYKWSSNEPTRNVRTPARNIIRGGLPGIRGPARTLGNNPTKLEVWNLLFDNDMIKTVVEYTNVKLEAAKAKIGPNTKITNYRNTDDVEIKALLGLFLLTSIFKSNDEDVTSLFSKDCTGRPVFNATMSQKRYQVLTACLRFDDVSTREDRKKTDKAAAITDIFSKLISNSQINYSLTSNVTVDEMLVPFRGRCGFRVFMPNKPKKYGIKIMCLTDSKTAYFYNGYIYTGKDCDGVGLTVEEQHLQKPTQCVIRLCKPIEGTNRNVTADNFFSSIELLDQLEERRLTYVGTMRKNKKEIPNEFLQNPVREVG